MTNDFIKKYQKKEVKHYPSKVLDKPLVSVCIQTYQHANYIKQCLESILTQKTTFPFEILLGEDDSTDGTKEICLEYAQKHPKKIRLFLHARENNIKINGQPTGRFNFVFNLYNAKGKYIALCEGDDYWTDPLKLQKQADFLENNQDYAMCFTRFRTLQQNTGVITDDMNSKYFKSKNSSIDFNFGIFAKGWHVGTQTLVFKKDLFDVNLVNKYKYFRDVHIFTELLIKGKGACLNFFGAIYRKHDGGIHTSINNLQTNKIGSLCYKELYYNNKEIKALKIKYYSFYQRYVSAIISNHSFFLAFKNILLFSIKEKDIIFLKDNIYKLILTLIRTVKNKIFL